HRPLRLARLPDADEDRFSLPRFDPRRADRPRPGIINGFLDACRMVRHSGMAQLLFQMPHDRPGVVSRTRSLHPADETQEHDALGNGRVDDYTSGARVLRLI